jgi:carotenoid 1,2-hydratase
MNITTDPDQEVWHELQRPGSYEWWYFDAEDDSQGISLVLIWFAGFAFSPSYLQHYQDWKDLVRPDVPVPSEYAGFSFQLYEHGREIINFIKDGSQGVFESSPSSIDVRFEQNAFSYDRLRDEYRLMIDFPFPARRKNVTASLVFKPGHRYAFRRHDEKGVANGYQHQWLLSVPKADVHGRITVRDSKGETVRSIPVRGRGYHDHNLGTVPMHEYIAKWYWGRAFSERYDLVYYVIFFRDNGSAPLAVLMLNDSRNGEQIVKDRVSFREENFTRGLFAPFHGRLLSLEQDAVGVEVRHHSVLDSGPFYLRFRSRFSLNVDGSRLDGIRGISEFLDPSALQSRFMRFFVRSRIWREGEESAMYRQYNFFKSRFDWFTKKKF